MADETTVTIIIHLSFTVLALLIMLGRLIARRTVFREFNLGDYATMGAILCAMARGALIYVVLTWGSNNLSPKARAAIDFTPGEIYRRTVGSKLVIANRPIYNTYLWLQKVVLLYFCIQHYYPMQQWRERIVWTYGPALFSTLLAAQIVGFTECDPFHLYWQVVPPPGVCVEAQVQLFVLGVLNIATDIMLLALPFPTVIALQTSWKVKLRLYALCTLGLFIIAITVIRLPINALNATTQSNRTTWASTELLTAAIVVNAPTLYGAFNKHRKASQVSQRYGSYGNTGSLALSRFDTANSRSKSGAMRTTVEEDDEIMLHPASSGSQIRRDSDMYSYNAANG